MQYLVIRNDSDLLRLRQTLEEDIREDQVLAAIEGKSMPLVVVSCLIPTLDSSYHKINVIEYNDLDKRMDGFEYF